MGNSLRCCLACVLPCGALDVIRIVHLNGYVEEMTRSITAGQVLHSYPNHVLSKPCSQGLVRKIVILSPDSELKRGGIYFLLPNSSLPTNNNSKGKSCNNNKKLVKSHKTENNNNNVVITDKKVEADNSNKCVSNLDLSKLDQENVEVVENNSKSKTSSKAGRHQRRRSSRGSKSGVWHPHLHSITEDDF
ncbi:uncharacterized protein LOC141591419 [Silene latifolia]|uniref:uncharacterized protein LOC141591419 n=1 Tax=Silene latifolia TaxID=37657 RepID=UPI003D773E6C